MTSELYPVGVLSAVSADLEVSTGLAGLMVTVPGLVAAVSAPISAAAFGHLDLVPLLLGFAILVLWKHRENIARLRKGTEPRVGTRN